MILKTSAFYIPADSSQPKKIINQSGGTAYYSTTNDTNAEDTALAVGSEVTIVAGQWFISASTSKLRVEDVFVLAPAGGITPASALPGPVTWQAPTAESGTDVAFAEKKLFTASIFLPCNMTVTGIKYLLGAGGGTNKVIAALFNSAGQKVANSSETTEGTVAGTEKTVQTLAFTTPYQARGPATYFVGITANGATAKLRTIPANTALNGILTAEISLTTKNVVPSSVTVPTEWIAAKGPVAGLY
jgi:hypothetical protein